jgi:hypothetical protein
MLFDCNYIKKSFSAILLVMLLAIHSIKLLHSSHPTNTAFLNHSCNKAALEINDISETANLSDCSICSYQLTKDADDLACASDTASATEHNIFNSFLLPFHKFSFHTAFENRGPPSII